MLNLRRHPEMTWTAPYEDAALDETTFSAIGPVVEVEEVDGGLLLRTDTAVAAGGPGNVFEEEREGWAFCYRPHVRNPKTTHALRVVGDSMDPLIRDGALVGVDVSIRDPEEILRGREPLAVVRDLDLDDGVMLRHVRRTKGRFVLFEPETDLAEFPRLIWDPRGGEPNPIVGKVVWRYQACE